MLDKLNLVMREILTGLPSVRAFSREKHEEKRFDKTNSDLTKVNVFVNSVMAFLMPVMTLVMNGTILLVIWNGANAIDAGSIQIGDMLAFMQYAMQIIMAFLMISMVFIFLPRANVSAKRIMEVINTKTTIKDPEKPKRFNKNKKGIVEFKDVSFKYPGAEEDVLHNIDFTAKPGETTAFIGSTGSGKSTIVNLIPRFFDVTNGSIEVDGIDIRQVKQKNLRKKIGYIPQKGILFSGDVESNVKYGNKKLDKDRVKKAIELAQASDFVFKSKEGLKREISGTGTNVSGGQKQRLAIARAIAISPDIYIFDDSFSALDFKTDSRLRKALKPETKESTVLIVAQRISTIMNADQIIVLEEGKIVSKGTHKELLKKCKVYKEIASSQLAKEEL
jgi:ATP-binding cassette subfamily B protein